MSKNITAAGSSLIEYIAFAIESFDEIFCSRMKYDSLLVLY